MTLLSQLAFSLLWIPYVWGGNVPYTGLDCSGMALVALKKVGIIDDRVDTTAQGIYNFLSKMGFSSCSPQEDCILFFGSSINNITHIAIAISTKKMIHARGGSSRTTSIQKAMESGAFVDITDIDYRSDLLASIKVTY